MREASEDCLYLNVFTPRKRNTGKPLPVMVYLHGGSNV
jgi:para-nitrobenzyl esterase